MSVKKPPDGSWWKNRKASFTSYLKKENYTIILSYLRLRRWLGILGFLLPFVCIVGGFFSEEEFLQQSISHYYYTNMRDYFVALLFCISMFLITYKDRRIIYNRITTISGWASLFVAFFPCAHYGDPTVDKNEIVGIFRFNSYTSGHIHMASAIFFFVLIAILSFFFIEGDGEKSTLLEKFSIEDIISRKETRNIIYICCGGWILACLIFLLGCHQFKILENSYLLIIVETLMLLAFSLSWLVKGESICKDKPKPEKRSQRAVADTNEKTIDLTATNID